MFGLSQEEWERLVSLQREYNNRMSVDLHLEKHEISEEIQDGLINHIVTTGHVP